MNHPYVSFPKQSNSERQKIEWWLPGAEGEKGVNVKWIEFQMGR